MALSDIHSARGCRPAQSEPSERPVRTAPAMTSTLGPTSAAAGSARRATIRAPIARPAKARVGPIRRRPTRVPTLLATGRGVLIGATPQEGLGPPQDDR